MSLRLFDLTRSQRRTLIALDDRFGSSPEHLNRRQSEDVVALWPFGLIDETRKGLTDRGRRLRDHGVVE